MACDPEEELSMPGQGRAASAAGAAGGMGLMDDMLKALNKIVDPSALQGLFGGKDLSKLTPEEAEKMLQGVDMGKLMKMYHSFLWQFVRSPVTINFLENDANLDELRLKLKDSVDQINKEPQDQAVKVRGAGGGCA